MCAALGLAGLIPFIGAAAGTIQVTVGAPSILKALPNHEWQDIVPLDELGAKCVLATTYAPQGGLGLSNSKIGIKRRMKRVFRKSVGFDISEFNSPKPPCGA